MSVRTPDAPDIRRSGPVDRFGRIDGSASREVAGTRNPTRPDPIAMVSIGYGPVKIHAFARRWNRSIVGVRTHRLHNELELSSRRTGSCDRRPKR
jgi:hypothetical protein